MSVTFETVMREMFKVKDRHVKGTPFLWSQVLYATYKIVKAMEEKKVE